MKFLLAPLAALYGLVTRLRNHLYDIGNRPSVAFSKPVISVGNLQVGGTGKTPLVAWLAEWLQAEGYQVAILSRGYGRKTRGFRLLGPQDTSETVGDEPLALAQSLGETVTVAVCEDRVLGLSYLFSEESAPDVVLLDDAMQHRRVRPGFQILVSPAEKPYFLDHMLPLGRLREHPSGDKRAQFLVYSKVPSPWTDAQRQDLARRTPFAGPLAFTGLTYQNPVSVLGSEELKIRAPVLLFCGLGQPQSLVEAAQSTFEVKEVQLFADHHPYTLAELTRLAQRARQLRAILLTTEKDFRRLQHQLADWDLSGLSLFYWPIRLQWLSGEEDLKKNLREYLAESRAKD